MLNVYGYDNIRYTRLLASSRGGRQLLSKNSGFSLVELMIVVAIISILGTIAVPSFSRMVEKAKIGSAKATLSGSRTMIMGMRIAEEKTLIELNGSTCSACNAGANSPGIDLNGLGNNPIVNASWKYLGFDEAPRDPWGRMMIVDENELEYGPADCRYDSIYSSGPDMRFGGLGDGDDVFGDDIIIRVPHYKQFGCPDRILGQMGN